MKIMIIMDIALFFIAVFLAFYSIKISKEVKRVRRINENYAIGAKKMEENIKKVNDEKKKLNTGNPTDDVNNATNIMSNIANKRSQS